MCGTFCRLSGQRVSPGDLSSLVFLENLNSAMSPNEDFGEPERVTEVVVERKHTSEKNAK